MKITFLLPFVLVACSVNQNNRERQSVMQTEIDFCRMAKEKGIAAAFYAFADDSAVIKRGNSLFKGKEAIKDFYESQTQKGELQWTPTFADVSGELAYTYGDFIYSEKDSVGNVNEVKGIFHTVWKKQKDGTWKFVWD
ncbi:MAG: hypothetical protein QM734_05280 [Cyclobacteriaceae bacterium]